MSVFGENDSRRLSNFLQNHIFSKFAHISRIYNQINYSNIWFPKVIIILIMTAQVLFFNAFSEKDPHLNAVEWNRCNKTLENIQKNIRSGALFYKSYTTDTFLEVITKEKCSKRTLCTAGPFSLMLKACSPEIPPSTKTGSKKNVFWECSEIPRKLSLKSSIMKLFY